jgi:thiol-disulfide isomerase/thioredoxin
MQPEKSAKWTGPELQGEWTFTFEGGGNDKVAPAHFQQSAAHQLNGSITAPAQGTVAPVSGDYGTLAGKVISSAGKTTIQLSRFDGIHILLLTGEFQPDGTLSGKLNTESFTAIRKDTSKATTGEASTEPDPESITTIANPAEPFRFSARDPKTGTLITQDDPRFKGKPYIVDIFGTWCPNCHDEAPVLQDIYKRYQSQGLEIVGLAYEYVDDPTRNARLLDIYRKKYQIGFPMLLAGTTDNGQIAKTLPQLQGFGAYPTTIFVGADGKVKKIHAGFSGPATGARFTEVKQKFEENVKQLVAK